MPKISAGLLLYRQRPDSVQVLLVHPGGPFWAKKDAGAWSIPKGEINDGEDIKMAAIREFAEELGAPPPNGNLMILSPLKQGSGKTIHVWAVEGEFDTASFRSNTFTMEWPPRSGKQTEFSEIDKATFFSWEDALLKISPGQRGFISQLMEKLPSQTSVRSGPVPSAPRSPPQPGLFDS